MNKKRLAMAFLVGLGLFGTSVDYAQQKAKKKTETTIKKKFVEPTALKKFKAIFDVTVVCSKDGKIKRADYKPKNFQRKLAVQYEDDQKFICHVLPGFIKKEDAQMASGSLLLHYLGDKKVMPKKDDK